VTSEFTKSLQTINGEQSESRVVQVRLIGRDKWVLRVILFLNISYIPILGAA
jgi:hypothetical protein